MFVSSINCASTYVSSNIKYTKAPKQEHVNLKDLMKTLEIQSKFNVLFGQSQSNENFEKAKIEFNNKLKNLSPEIKRIVSDWNLNDINITFANIIINNEDVCNDEYIMESVSDIMYSATKDFQIELAKKIFQNRHLYDNYDVRERAIYLINQLTTKKQSELVNKILSNEDLYKNDKILYHLKKTILTVFNDEQYKITNKILENEELYQNEDLLKASKNIVFSAYNELNTEFIESLLSNKQLHSNKNIIRSIAVHAANINKLSQIYNFNPQKFNASVNELDNIYKKLLEHPELYINGQQSFENEIKTVNNFFSKYYLKLLKANSVFDKEVLNTLLRKRFNTAETYLEMLSDFSNEETELISALANSTNVDGKPFLPAQKIEFIDLILGYKENGLNKNKIKDMISSGKVDISELNIDLLKKVLENCQLSEDEINKIPLDKLMIWDIKYVHLLAKQNKRLCDYSFKDIVKISMLENFDNFISEKSNKYSRVNEKTKQIYTENGLNYDAWLKPSSSNNIQFKTKNKTQEQLKEIAYQIQDDIEKLRMTGARAFINKIFPKYINNEDFIIPPEYETNKYKLIEFTKNTLKQLEPVFKHAENTLKNHPEKRKIAENTLCIKEDLNEKIIDAYLIPNIKFSNPFDLTIKMWDRMPQKDIFQGNYSTCCIAMGKETGISMPHYLLNTAYNMLELVDNKSGITIGNALCYFVKNNKEEPVFVIDNIEINNSINIPEETGKDLRKAITQYAANVAKEVTGNDNTHIYMGTQFNDVQTNDLTELHKCIKFLGDIDSNEIYMDLFGGWITKDKFSGYCYLFQLK